MCAEQRSGQSLLENTAPCKLLALNSPKLPYLSDVHLSLGSGPGEGLGPRWSRAGCPISWGLTLLTVRIESQHQARNLGTTSPMRLWPHLRLWHSPSQSRQRRGNTGGPTGQDARTSQLECPPETQETEILQGGASLTISGLQTIREPQS